MPEVFLLTVLMVEGHLLQCTAGTSRIHVAMLK